MVAVLAVREWRRVLRQPFRIVAGVLTPAIFLVGLSAGFAGALAGLSEAGYAGFLIPGIVAMAAMFAAVFASISLIEDRDSGLLPAVLAGPTPRWAVGLGKGVGVWVIAWAQGSLLVLAAPLLGLDLTPFDWLAALAVTGSLSAGVVGVSLALAWRCRDAASFHGAMNLVLLPAWMLSGAFYPADRAAGTLQWLTVMNPLSWPLAALRETLIGEPVLPAPSWVPWVGTAALAIGGILTASAAVRRPKELT